MVVVSPVIIIGIVNTTAIESENITLSCQTTYSINTTVTWKVNGNDVDIFNVSKYRIMKRVISETIVESNLMIINVTLSDVGMYTCVAENKAGNDISNGVLRVNGKYCGFCVYVFMCLCLIIIISCLSICTCIQGLMIT